MNLKINYIKLVILSEIGKNLKFSKKHLAHLDKIENGNGECVK